MPSWLDGLRKTRERFANALTSLFRPGSRPAPEDLDELLDLLVMADVPPRLASDLIDAVRKASTRSVPLLETARSLLLDALPPAAPAPDFAAEAAARPDHAPSVVLLVGINGSGKTTTAAKLAQRAIDAGLSPLLGAADTFRAAGSHQLKVWADRLSADVVAGATGADAAAAAYDAVDAAIARRRNPVLIDTAGRMHTREPLMRELQKLRSAIAKRLPGAPHHTWIVLDAMLGQNALVQARQFNSATPLDGLIVTKLDGSSKAGFLLGIREALPGVPILYAGLGESAADLVPFSPSDYLSALLPPPS